MTVCAYTPSIIQDIDYLMFEYINPHTKLTPGYIPITIEYAKTVIKVSKLNPIPGEIEPASKRRWHKLEGMIVFKLRLFICNVIYTLQIQALMKIVLLVYFQIKIEVLIRQLVFNYIFLYEHMYVNCRYFLFNFI